jgi:hypothetical protein
MMTIPEVKYRIVKNINSPDRHERAAAFVREAAADPFRGSVLYLLRLNHYHRSRAESPRSSKGIC